MQKTSTLGILAAAFMVSASAALAGPCDTGSKAKTPNEQAADPKSSDADQSSKNLAGGQQPASPGTVGAMNNAGADQKLAQGKQDDC